MQLPLRGSCGRLFRRLLLIIRKSDDDYRADAVVHAVIANAAEPSLGGALGGTNATAAHDDGAQSEPFNFQAEPLLHVVVLDDMDLEWDAAVGERLSEIGGLGGGESGEVVLALLVGLLGVVGGGGVGEVDGAPVGAVEYGGGADVEEDDGVAGAEVVVDGPSDSVGRLVA